VEGTSYPYVVDKIYVQTDIQGCSSLSLDGFKMNPKLVGNNFLQIIYSAPEVKEIVRCKVLVTMYRTTWRHLRGIVKYVIRNVI